MSPRVTARIAALAAIALAGCDGVSSGGGPGLHIMGGAGARDTIGTNPSRELGVQVRDEQGDTHAGVEVRFQASDAGSRVQVGGGGGTFTAVAAGTTDGEGRASVRIRFTTLAGEGFVAITVPQYGLSDTARFTVLPGNAVRVGISPRDTTIALGSSFTYRGTTLDRAGNSRPDPASWLAPPIATVSSAGVVTTRSFGEGSVTISAMLGATAVTDAGRLAVVPMGQVTVQDGGMRINDVTGDNRRMIHDDKLGAHMWIPGADRIVLARGGALATMDLQGAIAPIATPGVSAVSWPESSVDRQWIYFEGRRITEEGERVFRMHPDGTGLTLIALGENPTPSPDGRFVAYTRERYLWVRDLTTNAERSLVYYVNTPRWSPDGRWIAYVTPGDGELTLIRPDGSEQHRIGEHGLLVGISWSPDSKWIIGDDGISVTLVDVAGGHMTRLPWTGSFPSWRR